MKIFIGVPSGRGTFCQNTVRCIHDFVAVINGLGHKTTFHAISYAEIAMSRNVLVSKFLNSDCDLFVGVDDDIAVDSDIMLKCMVAGYPMTGTYIPQRRVDLVKFDAEIRRGQTYQDALRVAQPLVGPETNEEGIFEVSKIGTGCFVLRREPLETLIENGVVTQITTSLCNIVSSTNDSFPVYNFFNNIIGDDGVAFSEDYSFCHRLRSQNIPIHAYRGAGISHTGMMTFHS